VNEEVADGTRRAGPSRAKRHLLHERANLVVVVVSLAVLVVASLAATGSLTSVERAVFRAINGLPEGLHAAVWPLMQYGTFVTIPVVTVVALVFRRFRLAVAVALAGVGVYLLALVVKQIVERGRPGALVAGVEEREVFGEDSLGFPSGHAAVAAALTVVVAAHLSARWAIAAVALGTVVGFGRLYVAAHLPLDVIGGAALGAAAGGLVNLIVRQRPSTADPPS
jgi:undecaprenyl-diphosphatase